MQCIFVCEVPGEIVADCGCEGRGVDVEVAVLEHRQHAPQAILKIASPSPVLPAFSKHPVARLSCSRTPELMYVFADKCMKIEPR